ncbi:unnamed protein product [Caenorhabditis sp. 36 PRJEB53466]|nr:unnamed protein product [Caenorhabditis sp. 36 PRJEB53466]
MLSSNDNTAERDSVIKFVSSDGTITTETLLNDNSVPVMNLAPTLSPPTAYPLCRPAINPDPLQAYPIENNHSSTDSNQPAAPVPPEPAPLDDGANIVRAAVIWRSSSSTSSPRFAACVSDNFTSSIIQFQEEKLSLHGLHQKMTGVLDSIQFLHDCVQKEATPRRRVAPRKSGPGVMEQQMKKEELKREEEEEEEEVTDEILLNKPLQPTEFEKEEGIVVERMIQREPPPCTSSDHQKIYRLQLYTVVKIVWHTSKMYLATRGEPVSHTSPYDFSTRKVEMLGTVLKQIAERGAVVDPRLIANPYEHKDPKKPLKLFEHFLSDHSNLLRDRWPDVQKVVEKRLNELGVQLHWSFVTVTAERFRRRSRALRRVMNDNAPVWFEELRAHHNFGALVIGLYATVVTQNKTWFKEVDQDRFKRSSDFDPIVATTKDFETFVRLLVIMYVTVNEQVQNEKPVIDFSVESVNIDEKNPRVLERRKRIHETLEKITKQNEKKKIRVNEEQIEIRIPSTSGSAFKVYRRKIKYTNEQISSLMKPYTKMIGDRLSKIDGIFLSMVKHFTNVPYHKHAIV